jgi:hypothetical protein
MERDSKSLRDKLAAKGRTPDIKPPAILTSIQIWLTQPTRGLEPGESGIHNPLLSAAHVLALHTAQHHALLALMIIAALVRGRLHGVRPLDT